MPAAAPDPRLAATVIPPFVIAGLVDLADADGIASADWFAGLDFTPDQIRQPDRLLSFHQAATLIRRALRSLPPGPVGLRVGSREALVSFGMPGFAMLSARTVGEAMAIGLQYHQATGSLMDVAAEMAPGEAALRLCERVPDPELLPFFCEEAFAGTLSLLRAMLGGGTAPLRVELAYAAPPYAAAWTGLFGCPVHFNCDGNRLVLDAALLERPLATHSPANFAAALDACRRLAGPDGVRPDAARPDAARPDIVTAVAGLLRENLHLRPSMATVARQLCITERTLRRRLLAADASFAGIREQVFTEQAHLLLRDARRPVAAVAAELGFADVRDFRRAFRRWTGMTPTDFRRQAAASPEHAA
jgi:AraC-like DNA-binding protein